MVEPFALDGAVDEEKLAELLAVGTELDVLDYKATLDLARDADPKHRVEFAKDVAAFSALPAGGYLVVGADNEGKPAHDQESIHRAHFDEAVLRSIANSFMDGRLTIVSACHQVAGRDLAVVYIGPTLDGFPPMVKKRGWYLRPNGTEKTVFDVGDIYVRDGTSSRRIEHRDWPHVLANFRAKVKAEAGADTQQILARFAQELRESDASDRTTRVVVDIAMEPSDFEDAVADAVERGLRTAIRRALRPARAQLARAWSSGDPAEYAATLDRLASVAGVAVQQRSPDAFDLAIDELHRAYKSVLLDQTSTHAASDRTTAAATLWREIAARVIGILAMVVREEAWDFVRPLVLRRIGDGTYFDRSWLRHALTSASRAGVLVGQGESPRRGAMIRFARAAVAGSPVLHDDIPEHLLDLAPDEEPRPDDTLLDSICQADFLWCVVAVADGGGGQAGSFATRHDFYPSCAGYYSRRTAPVAEKLATDKAAREHAVDPDDATVAGALEVVASAAAGESGGWGDWSVMTDAVSAFVSRYVK